MLAFYIVVFTREVLHGTFSLGAFYIRAFYMGVLHVGGVCTVQFHLGAIYLGVFYMGALYTEALSINRVLISIVPHGSILHMIGLHN